MRRETKRREERELDQTAALLEAARGGFKDQEDVPAALGVSGTQAIIQILYIYVTAGLIVHHLGSSGSKYPDRVVPNIPKKK